MALPTTLVRWFAASLSAFDDAPLHNGLKRVDLSLSDIRLAVALTIDRSKIVIVK